MAVAEAVAAQISTREHDLGRPGKPLDRRSPFIIGMSAAAGVAVTIGVVGMIVTVRDVLLLIGVALFVAIGLEPAVSVSVLARHKLPRWAAVTTVLAAGLAVVGGFLAAALFPLLPYFFFHVSTALWVSIGLSAVSMFAVGVWKSRLTKRNPLAPGLVTPVPVPGAAIPVGYCAGVLRARLGLPGD